MWLTSAGTLRLRASGPGLVVGLRWLVLVTTSFMTVRLAVFLTLRTASAGVPGL